MTAYLGAAGATAAPSWLEALEVRAHPCPVRNWAVRVRVSDSARAIIAPTHVLGGVQPRPLLPTGGIDLTIGRYDNAEHSIFGTLDTTNSADFQQNCVEGAVQACGGEIQGLGLDDRKP